MQQKMHSSLSPKKRTENRNQIKRANSVGQLKKNSKKGVLKLSLSSASFTKNTYQSTFHTVTSSVMPAKVKRKTHKGKKGNKNKENKNGKNKQKHKPNKLNKEKLEELTDRKKLHLEYFIYKDTYIPIDNTEQRKLVYRIHLIDQRITFVQHRTPNRTKEQSAGTEASPNVSLSVQTQQTCLNSLEDGQSQTSCENRNSDSSLPQKNFVSALSDLEFLYLPDDKNFEGFAKAEKSHYRDLFLFMAKKFEDNTQHFSQANIESLISQRQYCQRGILESPLTSGIPTHALAVLSYLQNLFCYLDIHERGPLVDRINCHYGYTMLQKIARIRHGLPTRRSSKLLSQSTFWSFEEQLHSDLNFQEHMLEESLHYHDKAIFDCTNQFLQYFQPYYSSSGQPFPWNYNFETAVYCITEETFNALGCQIKQKVWQSVVILAGLILNIEQKHKYQTYINRILLNEKNMLIKQAKKIHDQVEIDQTRTKLLIELTDWIEEELIHEITEQIHL